MKLVQPSQPMTRVDSAYVQWDGRRNPRTVPNYRPVSILFPANKANCVSFDCKVHLFKLCISNCLRSLLGPRLDLDVDAAVRVLAVAGRAARSAAVTV